MERPDSSVPRVTPVSVNYHFLRQCNYSCVYCFHTQRGTRHVLPLADAVRGLRLLRDAGMKKINFSGGEPFLQPTLLGDMVRFCKEELGVESVSIITNGSMIKSEWFEKYGRFVDVLGVSSDSFVNETNVKIGRKGRGERTHIDVVQSAANLCRQYDIKFKMNTVVSSLNVDEDMNAAIEELRPCRWKVFQMLLLEGENSGDGACRDGRAYAITQEQFQSFCQRHQHQTCMIPESNATMKDSYLILDENMRFLNCKDGSKKPTTSILDEGVEGALAAAGFDEARFVARGGVYDWSSKRCPEW